MGRPSTKDDLLLAADEQYKKLLSMIDGMPNELQEMEFEFEDRDRNLRDVLAHLYEWHMMVHTWYTVGTIKGLMPQVPGVGYTWRTIPDLNREIWKKYQNVPLDDIKGKFNNSHAMVVKLIEAHSNEELFSKDVYKWTKSSTLGAYFVSSTSSHYEWAMKKIKKHVNSKK